MLVPYWAVYEILRKLLEHGGSPTSANGATMERLVCELVAIEVLYGFCGIGEDLVVASVYVESHVRLAVFFHF